jgi:hypothetical protein
MIKTLDLKWLTLIIINLSLLLCFISNSKTKDNIEITELKNQLANIETILSQPKKKLNLSPIHDEFKNLEKLIKKTQYHNNEQLQKLINISKDEIHHYLNNITDLLKEKSTTKNKTQYLSSKSLPFKVISIDSIQNSPVATVFYQYRTTALEKGDKLAGWQVDSIDFSKQSIELINQTKKRVSITLNKKEKHA